MKQMLELVDDAALERLKQDMENRGSRHEE